MRSSTNDLITIESSQGAKIEWPFLGGPREVTFFVFAGACQLNGEIESRVLTNLVLCGDPPVLWISSFINNSR
jgi:hypothetical protein